MRLQILFVSHFVPYPPKGGCFQRNFNLIRRLADRHDVHLVALRHKASSHPEDDTTARDDIHRRCKSVHVIDLSERTQGLGLALGAARGLISGRPFNVVVYDAPAVRAVLQRLVADRRFDVVHFDTIGLAQYLDVCPGIPTVVTHHGAESFMIRRRIANEPNLVRRTFFRFEAWALERYERRMCGRFTRNVVVSDDDGAILARIAPDASFATVPNGVDIDFFRPVPINRGRTVIFAGRLDQYSNRHGMLQFVEAVWPLVTARYPDARLDIIGNNPPPRLVAAGQADPRIQVHGFVPDVRPYFARADVALCPVLDGGGTRIKILDALSQSMPLVSTTIGCEGIAVTPGQHLLIADTPEECAAQIGRIFEDPDLRRRLAVNGRRLAEERYSWDALATRLSEEYETLVGAPRGARIA